MTSIEDVLAPRDKRKRLLVRERKAIQKEAHRVLQAAVVEAYGRAGTYVILDLVMKRVNISDPEEFRTLAEYLEQQGWIAEADDDYGVFVLTPEGIDEAMH